MIWTHIDTWIVVIGLLCAVPCALLGSFLVLRRMSMMGDAISHAVLPGLAVAFLLTGSRASLTMFLGAAAVGVLTAVFTQWVSSFGHVERGASMGVVFTTLFAIGLILIVQAADHVDLDPGCVLYGSIELAPLDKISVGGWAVPRAAVVLSIVLAVDAAAVALLFKELKLSSFDPALATTLGINARVMHYLLMTLVAVTVVAAFEAIGSILVIAMLIVPAAAARLLVDRLGVMLLAAIALGAASAGLGHVAAKTVPGWFGYTDTISSGMMALAAGVLFAAVLLLSPRHGIASKAVHRARLSFSILREDILGLLYRLDEHGAEPDAGHTAELLRRALGISPLATRLALVSLSRGGKIERSDTGYRLTGPGRTEAAGLVRTHRLWESFLVKQEVLPADHVHQAAERLEHLRSDAIRQRLSEAAGSDAKDPHGQDIPPGS